MRISESPANDWEPTVAAGKNGQALVAWDSYDQGNYDIFARSIRDGRLGDIEAIVR